MTSSFFACSRRRLLLAGGASALPLVHGPAQAHAFPARALTLLLGFPAGGSSDTVMRVIAEEMSRQLGQRVNVDNRAGAGGQIATQVALAAPADGYTLLFAGLHLATGPHLNRVRYRPEADIAMVGKVANVPVLLLAPGDSKLQTAADIAALAKRRGDGIAIGTGGVGTTGHFGCLMIGNALQIKTLHVPFRGGAAGLQGLASGEVDLMIDQMSSTMQALIDAGKVRILTVLQPQRVSSLAQVPSAPEFGLRLPSPLRGWQGLAVRAGTPPAVQQRLQQAWAAAAKATPVVAKVVQLGGELDNQRSPADVQAFYLAELARWGVFIRQHRIRSDS